jgi:DNA-binding MurR/RpiR family transcriptional regulator
VVTIRDVAKHTGVSPATVSRVVNGLVGYSDETRNASKQRSSASPTNRTTSPAA